MEAVSIFNKWQKNSTKSVDFPTQNIKKRKESSFRTHLRGNPCMNMILVHLYNWHTDDSHVSFFRIHLNLLDRQHNFDLIKLITNKI